MCAGGSTRCSERLHILQAVRNVEDPSSARQSERITPVDMKQKPSSGYNSDRIASKAGRDLELNSINVCGGVFGCPRLHVLSSSPYGTNANFITQLVGIHNIVKEVARGVGNGELAHGGVNTGVLRPARDPLYAKFAIDDEADALLLFNARDVDSRGRPLLMKVVAREGVDLDQLELSRFRTRWSDVPDVQRVLRDAAYVEIEDQSDSEFTFGDPLLYVSLRGGQELSRGVAVGPDNTNIQRDYLTGSDGLPDLTRPVRGANPVVTVGRQLDNMPPFVSPDRIEVEISANASFNSRAWLGASEQGVDTTLRVLPGLIYEPNAEVKVGLSGATAAVSVPADDVSLGLSWRLRPCSEAKPIDRGAPEGARVDQREDQRIRPTQRAHERDASHLS